MTTYIKCLKNNSSVPFYCLYNFVGIPQAQQLKGSEPFNKECVQ